MKRIVKKYYLVFIIDFFILVSFFLVPNISHASPTIRPIYEVLGSNDKTGQQIRNIWQNILNAINLFVILVLIAVAFSQILRINVNTYGVKKVLPAILLAAIAANFSFLICRLMVDISNVFIDFFILGAGMTAEEKAKADPNQIVGAFNVFSSQFDFEKARDGGGGMLMWYIIGRGLVIAGAILILILAFLFFIRNWVIYFLIPLAPLAFMATILPQTKSLFNQWWSNFAKWVFMPVVSCFWLWVGGQWYANVGKESGGSALLNFAFAVLCYYLALTTPFKLGGGVMGAWGNLGKKAWGATGIPKVGRSAWNSTGGAAINAGKDWVNDKYATAKDSAKNWAKDNMPGVKQINARVERGKIWRDLRERERKKIMDMRREKAFGEVVRSRSREEWEADKIANSRMKAMSQEIITSESGPNYKEQMKNGELEHGLSFVKDGVDEHGNDILRPVNMYENYDTSKTFYRSDGTEDDRSREDAWKQHGASAQELARRSRTASLNRGDNTANGDRPSVIVERNNLSGLDMRSMATSAVGSSSGGQSAQQMIQGIARPQDLRGLLATASYGHGPIGEDVGVIIKGYGPQAGALTSAIEASRAQRERKISEATQSRMESFGRELSGFEMITSHVGGMRPEDIRNIVSEARKSLDGGDTDRAFSELSKVTSTAGIAQGDKGGIETRLSHIESGIPRYEKLMEKIDTSKGESATKAAMEGRLAAFKSEGRQAEIVEHQRGVVEREAITDVYTRTAVENTTQRNKSATLGSSDTIEELASAVHGVHTRLTGETIEHPQIREVVTRTINDTKTHGIDPTTPLSSLTESQMAQLVTSISTSIRGLGASNASATQSSSTATPTPQRRRKKGK